MYRLPRCIAACTVRGLRTLPYRLGMLGYLPCRPSMVCTCGLPLEHCKPNVAMCAGHLVNCKFCFKLFHISIFIIKFEILKYIFTLYWVDFYGPSYNDERWLAGIGEREGSLWNFPQGTGTGTWMAIPYPTMPRPRIIYVYIYIIYFSYCIEIIEYRLLSKSG